MLLWFVGGAVGIVWYVFRDPAFDFRLVAVGALLPDVIAVVPGGAGVTHTLVMSIAALALVMAATAGRRVLRRHLLAVPIGMLLHLVLDGAWTDAERFWWPFLGTDLDRGVPTADRSAALLVVMELVGAALVVWFVRRFRLADRGRLLSFLRTGRPGRAAAAGDA